MKLLAFLLAFVAGFCAMRLRARHRQGLLEAVDELSSDAALSNALPDYRREVH